MPKRVKQHQLEDQSRHKFGLILPEEWVNRDKDKDYGIDVEVEIFDNTGMPTGLIFWVQLKATSSTNKYTIRNYNLKIETLSYYRQLVVPVLIVRYSSYEDKFYYKWNHEIDPFTAKETAKTIQVKFSDADCWKIEKTPLIIKEKLIKIKKLKQGRFSLPVSCNVSVKDKQICEMDSGKLLPKLRQELHKCYSDQIDIQVSKSSSIMNVEVSKYELKIDIEGIYHCVFHAVSRMENSTLIPELAKDIMLGLGSLIIQMGHCNLAARIFSLDNVGEKLAHKPDLLQLVLPQLLKTHEFEKAIQIAERAIEINNSQITEISNLSAIFSNLDVKNKAHSYVTERYLKKSIQRSKEHGPEFYGQALYNLGNFYRNVGENRKSIKHYLKARRHQPQYYNQAYFYSELAGTLFDIGKYISAARYYNKSLKIEELEQIKPLYADSLMFSGQYQNAFNEFDKYLKQSKDDDFEWHLKHAYLDILLRNHNIKSQTRHTRKALEFADFSECSSEKEREKRINKALSLDLLCSTAWFNLGVNQNNRGQNSTASFAFTMSGIINRHDSESWANATACAFGCKDVPSSILLMMVSLGYRYGREDYINRVHDMFEQSENDHTLVMEMIESVITQTPTKPEPKVIRISDPENKGKMINFRDYTTRISQRTST